MNFLIIFGGNLRLLFKTLHIVFFGKVTLKQFPVVWLHWTNKPRLFARHYSRLLFGAVFSILVKMTCEVSACVWEQRIKVINLRDEAVFMLCSPRRAEEQYQQFTSEPISIYLTIGPIKMQLDIWLLSGYCFFSWILLIFCQHLGGISKLFIFLGSLF